MKDTTYYDLLGLMPGESSSSKIRRAFYKKARVMHPDKNRDDPKAKEKFQDLSTAYQILGDDVSREKYNREGLEGVAEGSAGSAGQAMNTAALFALIFGNDKFEHLVGELRIVQGMELIEQHQEKEEETSDGNAKAGGQRSRDRAMDYKQWQREVQCAVHLAKMLDKRVDLEAEADADELSAEADFERLVAREAEDLAGTPFGAALLGVIGYVYTEQASMRRGGVVGSAVEKVKQSGHFFMNSCRMLRSGVRAIGAARSVAKAVGGGNVETDPKDEESASAGRSSTAEGTSSSSSPSVDRLMDAVGEKQTSVMVETLWNASVFDIEATLRKVCWKVLNDRGCSDRVRLARVESLYVVGRVFREKGSTDARAGVRAISAKLCAELQMARASSAKTPENASRSTRSEPTVKDMKRELESAGVDTSACVEKDDLRSLWATHFSAK